MAKREIFFEGQQVGTCFYIKDRPDLKPYTHAEFKCGECGNNFLSLVNNIKKGISCVACGRKRTRRAAITHGEPITSKEYMTWINIKNRCCNKNNPRFKDYGKKGIKVCERWINSFENFLTDMGRAPSADHSIDRFPDNNGDYELSNCRWATDDQQAINKNNNRYIKYNEETKLLRDFAKEKGINRLTLYNRIFKYKWPIEKAISQPVRKMKWNKGMFIPHSFGFIN